MRPITQTSIVLAALYHESGRTSVATGETMAHANNQAKPFAEFADIEQDAREGRLLTAQNLEQRVRFVGVIDPTREKYDAVAVDELARIIHDSEREAIELGKVVVKLNPPRPWIPFDQLPDVAQAGRRRQAVFFLTRFTLEMSATGFDEDEG